MKAAIPTRLPEPRPVLVATADVVSRVLRPRNLVGAVAVVALAACMGGRVGIALGLLAAPFLLGAVLRTGYRNNGRGRVRRELGHDGWSTARELREVAPTGPSTHLGSTTVGPATPVTVRVGHEASLLILGGPRRGKSLELASIVRGHRGRGPRYVSSTRLDLLLTTISAPRAGESPAWVFAPEGVGGAVARKLEQMEQAGWIRWMHWSPVADCSDPQIAGRRAAALIKAIDTGAADDQTWQQSARTVLRCLLHAAALGKRDLAEVYQWVSGPGTSGPFELLDDHGREAWAWELRSELLSRNESGADSVLRYVRQAIEFISDSNVAAACCPGPGDDVLDMRELIESDQTLYVVGRDREDGTQPLMAALTTHLYDIATTLALKYEDGKLPRALLLACDELAVTARVPWDDWLATAGGSGIHMVGVAQSPEQLRKRWPKNSILDNSTGVLVFGGLKGESDLRGLSTLCGERWERVPLDPTRVEQQPVLSAARLSQLRKFRALYVGEGHRPTILSTARWVKVQAVVEQQLVARVTAARAQITAPTREALPVASKVPIALPPATKDVHVSHAEQGSDQGQEVSR